MSALHRALEQGRRARGAALMGVINVTPDSFYDGGRYADASTALERVDQLVADGADLLDIGGESSRPGAEPVPAELQIARIEPVVRHAVERGVPVSIDTTSPAVAERMLALGAALVNDVSCLRDVELARVCARRGATLLVMHSREPMQELRGFSVYPDDAYTDVIENVLVEWRRARDRAVGAGMQSDDVWIDPGIGFAKNARQSFDVLCGLSRFAREGVPLVVGPSRKSFLGTVDDAPAEARLGGTIAACLSAVAAGASVLRVHDVLDVRQALLVAERVRERASAEAGHA